MVPHTGATEGHVGAFERPQSPVCPGNSEFLEVEVGPGISTFESSPSCSTLVFQNVMSKVLASESSGALTRSTHFWTHPRPRESELLCLRSQNWCFILSWGFNAQYSLTTTAAVSISSVCPLEIYTHLPSIPAVSQERQSLLHPGLEGRSTFSLCISC